MKRVLVIVAVGACAAVVVRGVLKQAAPRITGAWKQKLEEAPDDFPPKWLFINISAIREQTDRIARLLEERELTPA